MLDHWAWLDHRDFGVHVGGKRTAGGCKKSIRGYRPTGRDRIRTQSGKQRKCLERALRKRPDIRYLFVSGNPDNAIFGEDGLFDISQVLKKPFRQRELSERVRAVLDAATV